MKAYRVDFKFKVDEVASSNVMAESPEEAAEGLKQILSVTNPEFSTVEIVAVEEYKKEKPTILINHQLKEISAHSHYYNNALL